MNSRNKKIKRKDAYEVSGSNGFDYAHAAFREEKAMIANVLGQIL